MTKNNKSITLGTIPENAYVIKVHVQVMDGFNSDGTDVLNIGTASAPTKWANGTDVSSFGVKSVSWSSSYALGHQPEDYTVVASYVNGGSEPTLGRVLIMMEYVLAPDEPT